MQSGSPSPPTADPDAFDARLVEAHIVDEMRWLDGQLRERKAVGGEIHPQYPRRIGGLLNTIETYAERCMRSHPVEVRRGMAKQLIERAGATWEDWGAVWLIAA